MRLLALLLFIGAALAVKRYDGYKVLRFVPHNDMDIVTLERFKSRFEEQIDVWRDSKELGDPTDIMVDPDMYEYLTSSDLDINMSVMIDDVQSLIDTEQDTVRSENSALLEEYLELDGVFSYMAERQAECQAPVSCDIVNYGNSYDGRELRAFEMTTGSSNPAIVLECGIHAREWISPAVCLNLINRLINDYGSDAEATRMLDNFDWYIIPSTNPDGYQFTFDSDRMWRKTRVPYGSCFGADPNRNFEYEWGGAGTSNNPCTQTYRGPSAYSEPETAALNDYVSNILAQQDVRAYYSVHSFGQYFLIPWSYARNTYPADFDDMKSLYDIGAAAIQSTSGLSYSVGQSADLLGATAGCSDDWAKGTLGIKFAVTIELRDTGTFGFILPASQIQANFNEIWASFVAMTQEFQDNYPM